MKGARKEVIKTSTKKERKNTKEEKRMCVYEKRQAKRSIKSENLNK
jgi:hypothetical protein